MHAAETDTGGTIQAVKLYADSKLHDDDWLAAERAKGFKCLDCKAPVYFVRSALSMGGKNAFFRISAKTPHTLDSCGKPAEVKATKSPANTGAGTGTEVEGIRNIGGVKAIRYEDPPPLFGPTIGTKASNPDPKKHGGHSKQKKYVDSGGTPSQQETVGLRAHLTGLRNHADYLDTEMRLDVRDRGSVIATDYFCAFGDATADLAEPIQDESYSRLMAYWGEIRRVEPKANGTVFLDGHGMAIMLVKATADAFMKALEIDDLDDLKNCHVIAEGRLKSNQYGTGLYVRVDDIKRLAILPPKS